MENISTILMNSTFSTNRSFSPTPPYSKLEPFCLWLMNKKDHIPLMCKQMIGMDMDQLYQSGAETGFQPNEHTNLFKDNMEQSFATGRGVVGSLGGALLILVVIAIISCVKEHRRIQVYTQT